jgi:hypothetical protein
MEKLKISRKGQFSTLDLITAMLLFTSAVFIISWSNADIQRVIWDYETTQSYKSKAVDACNMLLKTPGSPEYWERIGGVVTANLSSLGFAHEPNVLEITKLEAFKNLSYGDAGRLLGLSGQDYNIRILSLDGKNKYLLGNQTIEAKISIERMAVLGGNPVKFIFSLSPK